MIFIPIVCPYGFQLGGLDGVFPAVCPGRGYCCESTKPNVRPSDLQAYCEDVTVDGRYLHNPSRCEVPRRKHTCSLLFTLDIGIKTIT